MKFAAIDIGSNAVRLLFAQVFENHNTVFKKDALYRVPIRLGEDVFVNQEISSEKKDSLINTLIAFKYLIKAYKPIDYLACATSAMREAENSNEIINEIKKQADIDIKIIDGFEEADIICSNHIADKLDKKGDYLYIDVGGGSTELTLISKNKIVKSQSFNIGTVRLLKEKVSDNKWLILKKWLKENINELNKIEGIGSGGNINKVYKMSETKIGKPVSYQKIKKIYKSLIAYSFKDRIKKLGLRPDRADVIIPALEIYIFILKYSKIKKLHVPEIGLSDGIIHLLYDKQKKL
ncbi:MAG: exopolyphosphatase [Candidatus Dadabacteria bacterium]|nr:exopolyphosphatase [Candidatus Dadabacteria bacterium]NIQ13661.1 exopolyphosphatase [Candidatus Dadabacteria bacterium]